MKTARGRRWSRSANAVRKIARYTTTGALALTLLFLPRLAGAQFVPIGAEFQVNRYTTFYPGAGAVATDPDGNFLVVWADDGHDGGGGGIFGRRYDSAGQSLGADFQINTFTSGNQTYPALSAAGGGFVVVWPSGQLFPQVEQDGDGYGVFARRCDAAGQPLGSEFQVNQFTIDYQVGPAIAAAADGSFVVVWRSNQDGTSGGVFARRYDSSGQALESEFQVNSYTSSDQDSPAVAAAADGAFVVVWHSEQDGDRAGVFGQRFDSAGQRRGSEFQVNSYTADYQYYPAVGAGSDGSFVVAWQSKGQDGDQAGVFARRYASNGQAVGGEFQVNSYTLGYQGYDFGVRGLSVASRSGGAFVIAWQSLAQDGDGFGVFAQVFGATGQRLGSEFQINSFTSNFQRNPAISVGANGDGLAVWTSAGDLVGEVGGIFGQRFELQQAPCGNSVSDPGEQCDDGNSTDGDGCDSNCTPTACGNAIVTIGEACDDGNTVDGDGCSSTCEDQGGPEGAADPELTAGETITTDNESNGATAADPVETTITMSVGTASATIAETSGRAPDVSGYSFFGQQVEISFDCPGSPCPSSSQPLVIEFRIDRTRIPSGVDENTIAVFRDGVLVPACTGAPGVAVPDPCIDQRQRFVDGDVGITVLTSQTSVWSFARASCSANPISCTDPGGAIFKVKKRVGDPSSTKVLWKWLHGTIGGSVDFGDPLATTGYTMCVYDGASLVESHVIAPGGDCTGQPCWKATGTKGFKYKNKSGNDEGVTKVLLKSGTGKAKIIVQGKGASVAIPASDPIYTQAPSLTVQLVASTGTCWQATYPNPADASTWRTVQGPDPIARALRISRPQQGSSVVANLTSRRRSLREAGGGQSTSRTGGSIDEQDLEQLVVAREQRRGALDGAPDAVD